MNLPPYGLCLPCVYIRCVDGDTIVVTRRGSDWKWRIRLLDCWAPERRTKAGKAATQFAKSILEESADELSAFVPFPKKVKNPLQIFSMRRVLGHIFVGTERTLSEMLVDAGHATKKKKKKKKK